MAQYRFEAKIVSRGKGHATSIAKAAYHARTRLVDERTGRIHDYSRKSDGLEFEAIFAPKDAPAWVFNRQRLWNEVEQREDQNRKRDTAQMSRTFIANFPHELTAQQREWMLKDFAREMTRRGMIVDMAIHAPDAHSDERNYHAHLQVTMREITPEGFGKKVRDWNKREELERWRERWGELGARQLERAGLKQDAERFRDGHLTLKEQRERALNRGDIAHAQELDREPTKHMGPNAAAMERERGIKTRRGQQNERIREANSERQKAYRHPILGRTPGQEHSKGWSRNPKVAPGFTRLYRVESIAAEPQPEWVQKARGGDAAKGRWFVQDENLLGQYRRGAKGPAGTFYVDVPTKNLEQYRASRNAIRVGRFSRDPGNEFFLPRALADQKKPFYREAERKPQRERLTTDKVRPLGRGMAGAGGKTLDGVASALESILAPLTPQQLADGERREIRQEMEANRSREEREDFGRDR